MTYSNFTNGAVVFRLWKFDGDTEVISKHAYMDHAEMFAKQMLDRDAQRKAENGGGEMGYFYIAVCENECRAKAFGTKVEKGNG